MIYLKSAVTFFTRKKSFAPISGLSNDMLFVLLAQGAGKLREFKVEGKINSGLVP